MAKRDRSISDKTIARRLKQGRGRGSGISYKPWIGIQDCPSRGLVTRTKGEKNGRIHHVLSETLEFAYLLQLEWEEQVVDIREQYPLTPIEATLQIALDAGIRYPTDPKTKQDIVMTTDFFITVNSNGHMKDIARTLKPSSLLTRRTIDKYEIERRYYNLRGIDWGIVTERDINYELVENIKWVRRSKTLQFIPDLTQEIVSSIAPLLFEALQDRIRPVAKVCLDLDRRLRLEPGRCLFIVRHMIANRKWLVDMSKRMDPSERPP